MEGFVLVQLHESVIEQCNEVDGMYLSYPSPTTVNFYIDKDGDGYWVTTRTLARILAYLVQGVSIDGVLILPWVDPYPVAGKIQSLVTVLQKVPEILNYQDELKWFNKKVTETFDFISSLGVLESSFDNECTSFKIPTLHSFTFQPLKNGEGVVLFQGHNAWKLLTNG